VIEIATGEIALFWDTDRGVGISEATAQRVDDPHREGVGPALLHAKVTRPFSHSSADTAGPPSAGCHTCSPVSGLTTHSPSAQSCWL
jgi:hypothetical protein